MTFTIECPVCGYVYEATAAQIRAGAWRDCPNCAAGDDASADAEESGVQR